MLKILWIDDDETRKTYADTLDAEDNVSVDFKMPEEIKSISNESLKEYSLIVIDYFLENKGSYKHRGLTMASSIRENCWKIPIFIISADASFDSVKKALKTSLDNFEMVLAEEEFENEDKLKQFIDYAKDYDKLKSFSEITTGIIIEKILNAPESSKEQLNNIIPKTLKNNSEKILEVGKWINKTLTSKKGPLYNKNHLRAFLGVKESKINQLISEFETSKYNGLFSKVNEDLWWINEIREILYKKWSEKEEEYITNIPLMVEKLYDLKEGDVEICPVCQEKYPNCFAKEIESEDHYAVVHYHCSEKDKDDDELLFFESERVFVEKDE